jgi:ribosomal protein S18 acetylase RimI-like enzyme
VIACAVGGILASRALLRRIRRAEGSDLAAIEPIASAGLAPSLLVRLGPPFLRRLLSLAQRHPATSMLVAQDEAEVVAFALATRDRQAFDAFARPRLVPALAAALVRRPLLAPAFLGSVLEPEAQPIIPAELLLLAVRGDRRRSSFGSELLDALEEEWRAAAVARYRVEVRSELAEALTFYRARGFTFEQERDVLRRPMTYLVRHLSVAP